jgi:DNA-directed RNA polymerase specialized sigma24 family protein
MVLSLVRDPSLHDELVQELVIHAWKTEAARPDQTPSWYRQSCYLHLLDLLRAGRSLDAPKRRHRALAWPDEFAEPQSESSTFSLDSRENPSSRASADDALNQLRSKLASREREVLELMTQEFTVTEIAGRLGFSHATVCASTAHIRAAAAQLGWGK